MSQGLVLTSNILLSFSYWPFFVQQTPRFRELIQFSLCLHSMIWSRDVILHLTADYVPDSCRVLQSGRSCLAARVTWYMWVLLRCQSRDHWRIINNDADTGKTGDHILSSDTICATKRRWHLCGDCIFCGNCKTFLCVLLLPANSYANARARLVTDLLFRKCSREVRRKI